MCAPRDQGNPATASVSSVDLMLQSWREWRVDCAMAQLSTNLDRFKFRPFGLAGGEPAVPSALYLIRDGQKQALRAKVTNMMLKNGDIVGSKLPEAAASAKPDCGRGSLLSVMSGSAM